MQLWGAHALTPLAAQRRLGARYDSAESLTTDNGLENPSYLQSVTKRRPDVVSASAPPSARLGRLANGLVMRFQSGRRVVALRS